MGLSTFILMYNASQSGSLQPPAVPQDTGTFYVSSSGTGNGLSEETPMSYETFEALALTDNRIVKYLAGDTV